MFGVLLLLAVVAIVNGIRLNAEDEPAPPDEPVAVSPEVAAWNELKKTCSSPRPQPGTAAYSGSGPHPYALFPFGYGTQYVNYEELEPGWDATGAADAALIVCLTVVPGDKQVATCSYLGTDTRVLEATYELAVYEAATGRLLDERSGVTDDVGCPAEIAYTPGETPELSASLDPADLHDLLEPWVTATV